MVIMQAWEEEEGKEMRVRRVGKPATTPGVLQALLPGGPLAVSHPRGISRSNS